MRQLHIGILDVVDTPTHGIFPRVMNGNLASIMPQVVGAWCERAGHRVSYTCYTGFGSVLAELPPDLDLLFVGAFTQAALFAYAVSNYYRQRGTVTVLGGPHARCYPEDAARFFDYVLGFTDRAVLDEVLRECAPHRPIGRHLAAARQPLEMPPLAERWRFAEAAMAKAPTVKIVPMIGSLGCPYTCSFCIDSTVDYQPLSYAQLGEDLRFVQRKMRRPIVGWHDPNFGVRFDEFMDVIEDAVPPGRMRHIAESSLSLLSEPHLVRMKRNGFQALLPGVESWFDHGNKSKTRLTGEEKVRQVSDQINMILRYVPYVRTNFVFGLDIEQGPEPFELTKRFLDRSPGVFAAYSLLTAYGRAAPLNLDYQRTGRVLPFPFQFLDSHQAMNVRPKNYSWPEFYDHVVALSRHSMSLKGVAYRFATTRGAARWIKLVESFSWSGRTRYHSGVRDLMDNDRSVQRFMNGESDRLPEHYRSRIQANLGPLYGLLPEGALEHDHLAYLKSTTVAAPTAVVKEPVQIRPRPGWRRSAGGSDSAQLTI
ncbi:MAG TPA: hypothetical protein VMF70_07370 [Gemmatimonadales bacterium]|nr:hypothetical protein [Gemmatimonadales bacterium]